MPPALALYIWFLLVVGLLLFDPAKDRAVSVAVWVPLSWMFILGSRLPSQWFGQTVTSAAEALQEGNPLDRTVFSVLILLALGILVSRSLKWGDFFNHNLPLVALVCFALVSVLWSDFPLVSFKRWYRDLGNYLVVLVVLSDRHPLEAIRTLLRRLSYLLIPLSVLFVKYYPQMGRSYDEFTGMAAYSGVTTTKDVLGVVCLVSGLYFFWDTATRWPARREWRTRAIVVVNVVLMSMTLWLLNLSDCATCKVCLAIGSLIVVVAQSKLVRRHPGPLKALIPLSVCLFFFLAFGLDMKASIATAVGRDPTFTDRTVLWSFLLNTKINPLVGTGYESFWLGPRLESISSHFSFLPTQAHNGFLEVYLNLGFAGVALMVLFLIFAYRKICFRFGPTPDFCSLSLAFWAVLLIDNSTSASFGKSDLLWLTFLLVAIVAPESAIVRSRSVRDLSHPRAQSPSIAVPMAVAGRR